LEVYGVPVRIDLKPPRPLCPAEELYGENSSEVMLLKRLRDSVLESLPEGKELIQLYYRLSPDMVLAMRNNPAIRFSVKILFDELMPAVTYIAGP
jgi:hypothetical protein